MKIQSSEMSKEGKASVRGGGYDKAVRAGEGRAWEHRTLIRR